MKKIGIIILGIMIALIIYAGWKGNHDVKVIGSIAYDWLDDEIKIDIIDKKPIEIKELTTRDKHILYNKDKTVNIKNMDVYKVTFKSKNEELLGPVIVYINRENLDVVGMEFRE